MKTVYMQYKRAILPTKNTRLQMFKIIASAGCITFKPGLHGVMAITPNKYFKQKVLKIFNSTLRNLTQKRAI